MVGCLGSEPRLAQSQTAGLRLFSGAYVKPPRLGEGSAGRAPILHRIPWHLPYNWRKSRKTSVRLPERRSADQRRTRFVQSTWPSPAMAYKTLNDWLL